MHRVQQLLTHYGLNASSATQKLGYSTTSKLYNILKGSEPSYPTLVDFLKLWPELSAEWLMLGTGPMLRDEKGAAKPKADTTPPNTTGVDRVLTVTVDKDGEENVSFVPVVAQGGYTKQFNEAIFLQQLRHYRIPGFEHGTFRAFEVSGDSMEPTLNHRDIVIGSAVERWDLLTPGEVYVVVTAESVMLKRIRARITDMEGLVELHSDNHHVKPYSLPASDISQLWRVRGYLSTYIPSAPDVTADRLWEVIEQLGFDRGEVRRHLDEDAPK
ncbi:S24 family peptidase [Hymenobacter cellulosivorans]|uniref:Peptidase S24/S26A/S26B/S26C domain-containing protein n=1 Tax=Hymenobacter cellulosivorans TaxID=2932249 RepID=A0ABY4F5H2_9BACT|nr:LexA family transcriptional regulator [Hymenobacter cellulosivorans]UOQ51724.1 hypothetical protein MUN80_18405 [Hymenobacter cellulosivorans]